MLWLTVSFFSLGNVCAVLPNFKKRAFISTRFFLARLYWSLQFRLIFENLHLVAFFKLCLDILDSLSKSFNQLIRNRRCKIILDYRLDIFLTQLGLCLRGDLKPFLVLSCLILWSYELIQLLCEALCFIKFVALESFYDKLLLFLVALVTSFVQERFCFRFRINFVRLFIILVELEQWEVFVRV